MFRISWTHSASNTTISQAIIMIPYASRTVDIILHPDCPLPKKGAKDVINLLKLRELLSTIEAVVQISPERYRLTFNHARQMQAFSNQDFFIHGKPVEFRSVSPFTWVYISRLSYGIPDEAITKALAPYSGGIKTIKSVAHENIYTGEHNVLMKITANIPARLRIAGHWCVVKYSGQRQVCFKCHKEGHVIADCPTHQNNLHNNTATNSSTNSNSHTDLSVPVAPPQSLASYAAVAGRNLSLHTPSESADGSSTPLNTNIIQSAPDCASGAPVSSASPAPSGGGSTVVADEPPSTVPSSPVRRRGKRRHSPIQSPQPEEKRAAPEDVAVLDNTAAPDPECEECPWSQTPVDHSLRDPTGTTPTPEQDDMDSRPETVPLPRDTDDEDDNGDDDETDMDDDTNKHTDEDGDDEINHNKENDDDENDDLQDSDIDRMDPDEYLDLVEDDYPSDDGASFATVSEAEVPNSPTPQLVKLSLSKKDTRPKTRNESAGAIAQEADTLYKLAAVLPTQAGSPSH